MLQKILGEKAPSFTSWDLTETQHTFGALSLMQFTSQNLNRMTTRPQRTNLGLAQSYNSTFSFLCVYLVILECVYVTVLSSHHVEGKILVPS